MPLQPGDKFGPYLLIAPIGKGGMGEVYRARDTKLKREVAIKVLPDALARDPDRMARFQREAEVLASLNHPNIAQIYGVSEEGNARALVMELVEGEPPKGPLDWEAAWKIASQIADALAYAHEKRVVHRDLKPANIKVTPDGVVKLLDFGLAKALSGTPDSASFNPENSPTVTMGGTVAGVILGTAAYMSPEQARGRAVDRRADIWAFGVVLYELLTGKKLFEGEDLTDTLARVVRDEPDLTDAPAEAKGILLACLEKDPKKRLQAIGDVKYLLTAPSSRGSEGARGSRLAWTAAVVLAIGLGIALWASWREEQRSTGVVRFTMETVPAEKLGPMQFNRPVFTSMTLSPNGNTLVFSGEGKDGRTELYERSLDQGTAAAMPGTEGAHDPFFSPDGEWVAFFAARSLKKVPVAGGPAVTIYAADTLRAWGANWGAGDQIVIWDPSVGLIRVPAGGGEPQPLVKPDLESEVSYASPWILPDGKTVLLTKVGSQDWSMAQVVARRMDTGQEHVLLTGGEDARYVPTGHLVYMQNGALMAAPFDARKVQVEGAPVTMIDGVMQAENMPNGQFESGMGQFAVSASGNLAYAAGGIAPSNVTTILRIDRKGMATELGVPKGEFVALRVSPDGRRLAVSKARATSPFSDIWVIDINNGNATRLTTQGDNEFPIWAPDGRRVLFLRVAKQVMSIAADGSGEMETVMTGSGPTVPASANEKLLVYVLYAEGLRFQIWSQPLSGPGAPQRFTESNFDMSDAELSPDGHWMVYRSNDSGANEIWVQAFPAGERHRISTNGGINPAWARSGRELFYLARGSTASTYAMMAVDFTPGAVFKAGDPRKLFEANFAVTFPQRSYDVMPDGEHFLMLRQEERPDESVSKLNVVLNWGEELKKRAPGR